MLSYVRFSELYRANFDQGINIQIKKHLIPLDCFSIKIDLLPPGFVVILSLEISVGNALLAKVVFSVLYFGLKYQ